jgi:hypothetical protein
LVGGAHDSCGDDVGECGNTSEDQEGHKCDYSALPGNDFILDDHAEFFKHHDVDESFGVGGVEVGDSVGLLEGEVLLEVDVDDLLLLVVEQVLNFVELSVLL